jgi:hypothetical protein
MSRSRRGAARRREGASPVRAGGAAVDTFVKKARYGAGLVGRAIWGDDAAQEPARAVNYEAPQRPSVAQPASSQSTLQPEDRQPAWNGPVPDRPV